MEKIEKLLVSGKSIQDVIGQGYAKSTVYLVSNNLKGKPKSPVRSDQNLADHVDGLEEYIKAISEIVEINCIDTDANTKSIEGLKLYIRNRLMSGLERMVLTISLNAGDTRAQALKYAAQFRREYDMYVHDD